MRFIWSLIIAALLLAAPAAPARAQFCGPTYQVQPGDTLYSIAERCGVSYLVLVSINVEMRDPDTIYPGQIIRLEAEAPLEFFEQPAAGPAQDAGLQPESGVYVVRPGDSLALIAYLYDTNVRELLDFNPQLGGRPLVRPGDVLVMPPAARREKGWLGVSTLAARAGSEIQVRLVDFTPYAQVEFRLGIQGDDDTFTNAVTRVQTDARGEARVTMRLPFFARRGAVWQVRVYHLEDADFPPVESPGITII